MNTRLAAALAAITLATTILPVSAETEQRTKKTDEKPRRFVFLTNPDSEKNNNEILNIFKETESPYFQDPQAPRFILLDRKNRVAFGIGGYIKTTISYDFAGIADDVDFITYDIPVPRGTDKSQFQMDASTSRIFFKLVGNNPVMKKFTAYIETDFRGGNYALHLRQAYLSFRGLKIGQAWSTFTDLTSIPPTIDFQGPNASTELLNVQLQYSVTIKDKWQIAVAVENPGGSMTYGTGARDAKQICPDFITYVQYSWNADSHIRFTQLYRGMRYYNNVSGHNRSVFGWGLQLSGAAALNKKWTLYYQATGGQGIERYINDLSGNDLDAVATTTPGKLKAPYTTACVVGVQYNITPALFISTSYSYTHLYKCSNMATADDLYKHGQYLVGNVFWTIADNWQVGAEYLFGQRKNQNNQKAIANRMQIMAQYNF